MLRTTHVRAALAEVLAAVDAALAADGFLRATEPVPHTVVDLPNGETLTLLPELPPSMRRLFVIEKDGWVALADHPFSRTEWGACLSVALEASPVITLRRIVPTQPSLAAPGSSLYFATTSANDSPAFSCESASIAPSAAASPRVGASSAPRALCW
jgi:hypothetical protein